jgi:hypothetical protein
VLHQQLRQQVSHQQQHCSLLELLLQMVHAAACPALQLLAV